MIAETLNIIFEYIDKVESPHYKLKSQISTMSFGFYDYKDAINSAQDVKQTWSKISQILLKVAEFLTDIGLTYYQNGKISIKWYQYPSVISKLKKFIASLNDRN